MIIGLCKRCGSVYSSGWYMANGILLCEDCYYAGVQPPSTVSTNDAPTTSDTMHPLPGKTVTVRKDTEPAKPAYSCPYPPRSASAIAWQRGYWTAFDEMHAYNKEERG